MGWLNRKRVWQLVALVLAAAAAVVALVAPLFAVTQPQGVGQTVVRANALEVAGPSVFIVVAIPILLAAAPLALRGRAWAWASYASAAGLIIYTITGLFSIGLLVLPATLAAVVGAFIGTGDSPRQ